MASEDRKFALLIDADNISPNYMNIMLSEAKNYGTVSIRRIYGDWTSMGKNSWKNVLLDNSLTPIQQYSYTYGKNASDSAMIIDAMDILYADHVDGFILASSDSDFTRLAMRLREDGKFVIGMGESKTPAPFVKSCDEFKVLDILFKNSLSEEEEKRLVQSGQSIAVQQHVAAPITKLKVIKKSILEIIDEHSDENGQILLSELGRLLTRLYSDFDARNYGKYRKFSDFIKSLPELDTKTEDTVVYVTRAERGKGTVNARDEQIVSVQESIEQNVQADLVEGGEVQPIQEDHTKAPSKPRKPHKASSKKKPAADKASKKPMAKRRAKSTPKQAAKPAGE